MNRRDILKAFAAVPLALTSKPPKKIFILWHGTNDSTFETRRRYVNYIFRADYESSGLNLSPFHDEQVHLSHEGMKIVSEALRKIA